MPKNPLSTKDDFAALSLEMTKAEPDQALVKKLNKRINTKTLATGALFIVGFATVHALVTAAVTALTSTEEDPTEEEEI